MRNHRNEKPNLRKAARKRLTVQIVSHDIESSPTIHLLLLIETSKSNQLYIHTNYTRKVTKGQKKKLIGLKRCSKESKTECLKADRPSVSCSILGTLGGPSER